MKQFYLIQVNRSYAKAQIKIPCFWLKYTLYTVCLSLFIVLSASSAFAQSGTAFRDYNGDGVKQSGESGVNGVLVKLYVNTASTQADTLIGATTTNSAGLYNFNGSLNAVTGRGANVGEDFRLEFEIPAGFGCLLSDAVDYPAASADIYGSQVQFATGTQSGLDFAVSYPIEYVADANPQVFIPCYVNGDPISTELSSSHAGIEPALVWFNWQDYGVPEGNSGGQAGVPQPRKLANASQVGALYGLAFSRPAQKVFAAAVMRRHAGFGPLGPGGIYMIDPQSTDENKVSNFLDLDAIGIPTHSSSGGYPANPGNNTSPVTTYVGSNAERGLFADRYTETTDYAAGDQVGKVSLGDIDISDDGRYLYVVNLYDRKLYEMDLADPYNPQAPTSANRATRVRSWSIPDPGTSVDAGEHRPWGAKYYRGKVYIGIVMSGQDIDGDVVSPVSGSGNSQIGEALSGHVYEFDLSSQTFASILDINLDYGRERPWIPWGYSPGKASRYFSGTEREWAEPIIADIEFDDKGGLLIGIMDRKGHQYAINNRDYKGDERTYEYATAGELLRGAITETSDSCTYAIVTRPGSTDFYDDDIRHPESLQGPLAVLPGGGDAMAVVLDPINIRSGGVIRFNNTTGNKVSNSAYEIFDDRWTQSDGRPTIGSKANGLGDIEVAGLAPGIEIGNRVWEDIDRDGIQDAGEPGIENVTVELYDISGTTLLATTSTNASGEWFFGEDNVSDGDVSVTGNQPGIRYRRTYIIKIGAVDFVEGLGTGDLSGKLLTLPDQSGTGLADQSDSDANIVAGLASIQYTAGTIGENDHSLDIGFYNLPTDCYVLGNVLNSVRDDQGTPQAGDDTFTFDIVVLGGGTETSSAFNTTPAPSGGNPGTVGDTIAFGPFGAAGGDITITISDTTDSGCLTIVNIPPPPVACAISATVSNIQFQDQGTADIFDDTFTFDVKIDGSYTGENGWESDGTESSGAYGDSLQFGPYSVLDGAVSIYFTDADDDLCQTSVFVNPFVSLGSTVFADNDGDGIHDSGEPGIPGVALILNYDLNADNDFDDADETGIDTTYTDLSGNYLFENLRPGNYQVMISADEFSAGNSLAGFPGSSVPTDINDNGEDGDDNGIQSGGSGTQVVSPPIVLAENSESTNETSQGGYQDNADDDNGNMTVDFGFIPSVSLGSTVFLDNDNDGIHDSGEPGIAGVVLKLNYDSNDDSDFEDAGETEVASDTTDANGNYFFSNLLAGRYQVVIPVSEFGTGEPLANAPNSSTTTDTNDNSEDSDDNGIQTGGTGAVVVSPAIVLAGAVESTSETGSGKDQDSTFDANGDMTVDFGFVPAVSIGSTVFLDENNNGLQDGTETGISGVKLILAFDANNDNDFNDAGESRFDSTISDANGNYLFQRLLPGAYRVEIRASEFSTGRPLEFTQNSSTTTDTNDNADDSDDNGAQSGGVGTQVLSPRIVLSVNGESTAEAGQGSDQDDEDDNNGNMTVDFGFTPDMSLGSTVFADHNNNGIQDTGEDGIAGVQVKLNFDINGDSDFLDAGEANIASTHTDINGDYHFTRLAPGTYQVFIDAGEFGTGEPLANLQYSSSPTDSSGNQEDGDDNGIQASGAGTRVVSPNIVLAYNQEPTDSESAQGGDQDDSSDNNGDMTIDFGFTPLYAIGNQVWLDANNNGIKNITETGLPNVRVELYEVGDVDADGNDGALIDIDSTNANGLYLFDSLVIGDYIVVIPASNFAAGGTLEHYHSSSGINGVATGPYEVAADPDDNTDGDDDGSLRIGGVFTGAVLSDTLSLGLAEPENETPDNDGNTLDSLENLTVDFGFYISHSVGNQVWLDVNNNGIKDAGESGIANVRIELYEAGDWDEDDTSDELVAVDSTDASGLYLFDSLIGGDYVLVIPFSNFVPGHALEHHASSTGINGALGTYEVAADPDNNLDGDDNGTLNANSAYILAVVSDTLSLGASEPEGEDPDNDVNTADSLENLSVDFGFFVPQSIGNQVWLDANNNVAIDAGETGLVGVRVELYEAGDVDDDTNANERVAVDSTDSDGLYLFDSLVAGDYIVVIPSSNFAANATLENYISSTGINGEANGPNEPAGDPDSDSDAGDDGTLNANALYNDAVVSDTLSLGANEPQGENPDNDIFTVDNLENLTVDFGFYVPRSVGNHVWFDIDNDGIKEANEAGIARVRVELYESGDVDGDSSPNEQVGIDSTDAQGLYLFDSLAAGDYIVLIPASNFQAGGVLYGLVSASGAKSLNGPFEPAPDPDGDRDGEDDGTFDVNPLYAGAVASDTLSLGANELRNEIPDNDTYTLDSLENLGVDFAFIGFSLGNYVWLDVDNSGHVNEGEDTLGLAGVVLELLDSLLNPVDLDPVTSGIQHTDTTDENGYYLFTGLRAGKYIVRIASSNFASGEILESLYSSTGRNEEDEPDYGVDQNDNGLDPGDSGYPGTGAGFGILSGVLELGPGSLEPLGETPDNDSTFTPDTRNHLALDFGLWGPLSLGDYVWLDENVDGVQDAGEQGIEEVVLKLEVFDHDANAFVPAVDVKNAPVALDTTDASGLYTFENLPSGTYRVTLLAGNWDPGLPFGVGGAYESAMGTLGQGLDDGVGNDDNGDQDFVVAPAEGIRSDTIALFYLGEANREPFSNVNRDATIDFGIARAMSLGNRVWNDVDNDGINDPGEEGLAGVVVELHRLVADTCVLAGTDTTDAGGYYLFTLLPPDDYIAVIPTENFSTGQALAHYVSSTGTNGSDNGAYERASDPDNDSENDDDGTYNLNPMFPGAVASDTLTLFPYEPTADMDSLPVGASDPSPDFMGNYTVDFGFYMPQAIGNQIFHDLDNDGVRDTNEVGLAGVLVQLYYIDTVGDSSILVLSETSDANGNYLFDSLIRGEYFVAIPAANFATNAALENFDSSTGTPGAYTGPNETAQDPDNNTDNDDNGSVDINPEFAGAVLSDTLSLGANEPVSEDPYNDPYTVDSLSNLTVDFGFYLPVAVGDYVWYDINADGTQVDNGMEGGVAGVIVTLYNRDTQLPVMREGLTFRDTTGLDGSYLFEDLPPGNYYVVFDLNSLPESHVVTYRDASGNDDNDSDVERNTGKSVETGFLFSDEEDLTLDMGIFEPVNVGDYVWYDNNADGKQVDDGSEPGVEGVKVSLYDALTDTLVRVDAEGNPILPQYTGADGAYLFANLRPNAYYVVFDLATIPAGHIVTYAHASDSDENDSDAARETGKSTATDFLNSGTDDLSLDMGIFRPVSVGDYVWYDTNADGIQVDNGTEPGVEGINVTLYDAISNEKIGVDAQGNPVTPQYTRADGAYLFANLRPGNYYVVFDPATIPSNYVVTYPDRDASDLNDSDADRNTGLTQATGFIASGHEDLSLDMGIFKPVTVGDFVWYDLNKNGVQDTDEPGVAGVEVVLFDATTGSALATQITNAEGKYRFEGLNPGSYYVSFSLATLPVGYQLSNKDASDDSKDSDADENGRTPATPYLVSAMEDLSLDMGIIVKDSDGDGVPDIAEEGDRDGDSIPDGRDFDPTGYFYDQHTGEIIPGGKIEVIGPGSVNMVHDGSQGYYQFFVGAQGTYTIKVTAPAGYILCPTCLPSSPPPLDAACNGYEPIVLGVGEKGNTGYLAEGYNCTPYYLELIIGECPLILFNNIPLLKCAEVCELTEWNASDVDGGERNHAIYLYATSLNIGFPTGNFDSDEQRFVWENGKGQMVNWGDSVVITGTVVNKVDTSLKFAVFLKLIDGERWSSWSAKGREYVANREEAAAVASTEHPNWRYYILSDESRLVGLDGYAGDVLYLTAEPADHSKGFQLGFGANDKDGDKGMSGWFRYRGTMKGNPIEASGDLNIDIDNCTVECAPIVPTVVDEFYAKQIEAGTIIINWGTAVEGADYVVIERSLDGTLFEEVKKIDEPGTNLNGSDFEEEDVVNEGQDEVYYRIKIVKPDGSVQYTEVLVVKIEDLVKGLYEVYPNPATKEIRLRAFGADKGLHIVTLYDLQGREVHRMEVQDFRNAQRLDVQRLTKGLYIVEILRPGGQREISRIEIMN